MNCYLWGSLQLVQAQLPGLAEGLDPVGLDGLSHHAALDT